MLLDLNDPKSIVAWWEVFPERHGPLLANWAQRRPEVRGAIAVASQMIRANPRTAVLMREAELRRAAAEVQVAPPSHDEQLAHEYEETAPEASEPWEDQWHGGADERALRPAAPARELEMAHAC